MNRTHAVLAPLAALAAAALITACGTPDYSRHHRTPGFAPQQTPPPSDASTGVRHGLLRTPYASAEQTHARLDAAEELWIIPRTARLTDDRAPRARADQRPSLRVADDPDRALPMLRTDVHARIAGWIASVDVAQTYHNPSRQLIEAEYVFPLPQDAAVTDFLMTIGERTIRGVIRERDEAQRIYQAAKSSGRRASIMDEHRPNVFSQRVANIEPGESIRVDVTYFNALEPVDGVYEFVFPAVVAPRYNPDGPPLANPGGYADPDNPALPRVDLALTLDAGAPVAFLRSPSHDLLVSDREDHAGRVRVDLDDDAPFDRDFVLRYALDTDDVLPTLVTHRDETGGYLALAIHPPADAEPQPRDLDLILVMDTSGSMEGEPIRQSRDLVLAVLDQLTPDDSFHILTYANRATELTPGRVPATRDNLRLARRDVRRLDAKGGTEIMRGLRAALAAPPRPGATRFVVFITDGLVSNEAEVLDAVHNAGDDLRVFSAGIGASPNRYLMDRLARAGLGFSTYLGPGDKGSDIAHAFIHRARRPLLTDVTIDWGDLDVHAQTPRRIPDLYADTPVVLTARFNANAPATVRVRGRSATGTDRTFLIDAEPGRRAEQVALLWARDAISALADEAIATGNLRRAEDAADLALRYNLLSPFTSFVAVDSLTRVGRRQGVTVPVPAAVPRGTTYTRDQRP